MNTIDPPDTTTASSYPPPVDKLLTYGEPDVTDTENWPDYLELGFTAEHIPALISIATDKELNLSDSEGTEIWAPTHAWRVLGQLHAVEAVEPLLTLFDLKGDSEWVMEELPEVFGLIGPQALPTLEAYLADSTHKEWARVNMATGVKEIGKRWPDARLASIAILSTSLEHSVADETDFSSSLVTNLIDLEAKEAAPVIEQAFKDDRIDLSITGDWDDVRESLGLMSPEEVEKRRAAKVARLSSLSSLVSPFAPPVATPSEKYFNAANPARSTSNKKAKNKKAKQSRKKNRKR